MNPRLQIVGLVLAISAILGFNLVALKVAMRDSDPITVQALSTVVGTVAMLGLTRAASAPLTLARRSLPGAFAVGMALNVASSLGVAAGVERVSAGLGALLLSATPIMTLLLDLVFTRDRHSWHGPVGVLLGCSGVAFVAAGAGLAGGRSEVIGVAYLLFGAFGWSFGLVLMKTLTAGAPPTTFTAWQMLLGTPVLLVIGYATTGLAATWSLLFALALAYSGAMAKAVSFMLQLLVVRVSTALHASLTAFVMPVFATVAGTLLLGERVRPAEVAGAIAIFTGVALVLRSRAGGTDAEPAVPSA